jgi:AbrB family looped-hinge helix DNA binding protein
MVRATATIGRRGQTVIPAALRKRFGIEEGKLVIFEPTPEGILIRPAVALPVETYSPQRKAELILSNATDARDYRRALKAVAALGVDPATIRHHKPRGV